ncbi:MAG: hypothetical protein HQ494_05510 [Rhodospirillales bacterium]|nr:hypothetical protein [Rhodospirillales bacterium]
MKAFEIQTYLDGKWRIDSVFDDRELALFEARRVDQGSRYSGVRVIEENYDESSDLTTTRTIFRGSNLARRQKAQKGAQAIKAHGSASRGAGSRERQKKRRPRQNQKSSNYFIPVLILSVLVVAGLAALYGLQALSQLR